MGYAGYTESVGYLGFAFLVCKDLQIVGALVKFDHVTRNHVNILLRRNSLKGSLMCGLINLTFLVIQFCRLIKEDQQERIVLKQASRGWRRRSLGLSFSPILPPLA